MPRRDGTGPFGAGPGSGRGAGPCTGYAGQAIGYSNGFGKGFGYGSGCGRAWGHGRDMRAFVPAPQLDPTRERAVIEDRIKELEARLDRLKSQSGEEPR